MTVPTVAASGRKGHVGHRTTEAVLRSDVTLQPRITREVRIALHKCAACKRVVILQPVHQVCHLAELSLRDALSQADGRMRAQHRFHAFAKRGEDGHSGKFTFLPCQHVALKDVAEQMFFQELLDDRGEGGVTGFGRIDRSAAQLFKEFRPTGVFVAIVGYG